MASTADPQVKAAALADILTGASVHDVARKHNVSRPTVRRWRQEAGVASPVLPPESQVNVGQALDRHICTILEVLNRQLRDAGERDWFEEPNADGFIRLWNTLQLGAARIVAAQHVGAVEDDQPTPIRRAV